MFALELRLLIKVFVINFITFDLFVIIDMYNFSNL